MDKTNLFRQPGGYLLLDGASGTMMIEAGLPVGICPELFAFENPKLIADLHEKYYEAGSDLVYTFTFGGNALKLKHFGLDEARAAEINFTLAQEACKVRDRMKAKYPHRNFYVAGDIGPCGEFMLPAGEKSFDDLMDVFAQQAKALARGGVDLFVVETMMDLNEARAAAAGIASVSDLPIMLSMTFEEGGRTLSGNTPEAALVTLSAMGVSAFGANCSTGPDEMVKVIESLAGRTRLPIIAKPNAGMPVIVDGKTVFPMKADVFSEGIEKLLRAGAGVVGGCCGTMPDYINSILERVDQLPTMKRLDPDTGAVAELTNGDLAGGEYVSSASKYVKISSGLVTETVLAESADDLTDLLMDAADEKPDLIIIDFSKLNEAVSEGETDVDEVGEALAMASMICSLPLGVKNTSPKLLESLAKNYPGRLAFFGDDELDSQPEDSLLSVEDDEKDPVNASNFLSGLYGRFGIKVV